MPIATEVVRPEPHRLPAEAIEAPAAVKQALAKAVEAGRVLTDARDQKVAAEAAVAQADEVDRAADRSAVAEGKSLSAPKAGRKAREAVEAAERRLVAADGNYTAAVERLTAAVGVNAAAWLEVLRKQRAEARGELRSLLDRFARAKGTFKAVDGTIDCLAGFVDGTDARVEGFPTTADIERVAGEPARIRDQVLATLRGSRRFGLTDDQADRMLVELELIAADERPWDPGVTYDKDALGDASLPETWFG